MKKEREDERFKAKQAERQRMIDHQINELRALQDNQQQVLNRQVAEAEDKANRLYEQQEQRKREMKEAIERSRALQVHRLKQENAAKIQEDKDFAEFWRIRNEELQLAEQQEKEEDRQRAKELANFIHTQANAKQEKAIKEFQKDQDNAVKTQALLDQQEK